jgi:hypothetical protein
MLRHGVTHRGRSLIRYLAMPCRFPNNSKTHMNLKMPPASHHVFLPLFKPKVFSSFGQRLETPSATTCSHVEIPHFNQLAVPGSTRLLLTKMLASSALPLQSQSTPPLHHTNIHVSKAQAKLNFHTLLKSHRPKHSLEHLLSFFSSRFPKSHAPPEVPQEQQKNAIYKYAVKVSEPS